MPVVDIALKYINKGISIIPVNVESKAPLLPEWKLYQARIPSPDEVNDWYRRWPEAGIAVICGYVSGKLAVFDVDTDHPDLAKRMLVDRESIQPMGVQTPSGGLHMYVREKGPSSRNYQFFCDIGGQRVHVADLKAEGGYVLAPPSPNYTMLNNNPVLDVENAQVWAEELLRKYGVELSDTGSKRAYDMLKTRDIGEGERDSVLTSYAGKLWNDGWAADRILMTLKTLNKDFCKPPLPDEQVEKIVASVSRYQREGQVIELPSELNPIYPGRVPKPRPKPFLIDGIVPEKAITLLYGDGGQGKSFVALGFAISVAIGEPIFLRAVRQTNVLYLDWELDADEITHRAYRIASGMGLETPPKNAFCYMRFKKPFNMVAPALQKFIEENKIGFVVIDSVGMAGCRDINSTEQILSFFEQVESLNTTVLAIDHQPKLQKDQAYGSLTPIGTVYKFNASRSVLQLQKTGWKEGQLDEKIEPKKLSFGSQSRPIHFSLLFQGDKIKFLPYVATDGDQKD